MSDLAHATGGKILSACVPEFHQVGTDSRQAIKQKLFIALKGERFDGHNFVEQAVKNGASALLVHEWRTEWKPLLAQASFVQVPDTLSGLQDLGHFWRKKCGFTVLAVTGSNGKTTTKEFLDSILRNHFRTSASAGSLNNHWGVPLALLSASPNCQIVISEMGMNHRGELQRLCTIAEPNVVTVTSVGRAHIGELGSQENIALAKEEIYAASPAAIHIFNMDNEWTCSMRTRSRAKQLLFSSFRSDVDVHLRAQRMTWQGLEISGTIHGVPGLAQVPVLGRHNVVNLMCASALALAVGLEPKIIWEELARIRNTTWGRNQLLPLKNGAHILFDAYNANPDSMRALFSSLYEMDTPGRKFLVVADMKELGRFTEQAHEELGERAGAIGFAGIWFVGQNGAAFSRGLDKGGKPAFYLSSPDKKPELARDFLAHVQAGDLVAVKGSRSMELEKVVASWPLQVPLGKY